MKKVKLLAIAPYEGLAEILRKISKDRNDIILSVETGDLNTGVQIAKEHAYENYDAIISRGGTADLLRSTVEVPVIEISISVYDVLRAIKTAELSDAKFAIIGFSTITDCAKVLCDLLQYKLDIITFNSESDVFPVLTKLKDSKYDLVLCDMIGSTVAEQLGLNYILISSSIESVNSSLDKAIQLVQSMHYVHKQKEIFQKIITNSEDNLIIYDPNGEIWFSYIADSDIQDNIINTVNNHLDSLLSVSEQIIETIIDNYYVLTITSTFCFYDGEKYTAIRIAKKKIALIQDSAFSIYNAESNHSEVFKTDFSSSNYIGMVRKQIEEYSRTHYPVLIIGESGTGKEKAATIIYKNGPYSKSPLYTINCSNINAHQWHSLLSQENSPLYDLRKTIFFKDITALDLSQFDKLIDFFSHSNLAKRNRLIFSVVLNCNSEKVEILDYLKNKLSCLQLFLPPLRERITELPSIIALYINKLNTSLGKQIIGMEPKALSLMKNFPWKDNLNQLYRILSELVILTQGSYISEDQVFNILSQEQLDFAAISDKGTSFTLNKTLDEINYDIIQAVLKEEGQNKERTAKRLGISRSTLWRKLSSNSNN
ncbi:sigma-54-dependent Fis family transcriptional regulator [Clostridium sp. UBA6640]|uniref:sigma-54-dependent Fis family transcriptional regulator n=1 Tax=Clostridium sp. UBA6640 TaxID=1946370 RepID=UPI0025B817C7|nr:sigma-54-dependent transcriptional regulator [Clostridium sp. UBA6640]